MVFSSNLFLFTFLPLFFLIYYPLPSALKNAFLFMASLFFYTYGAGPVVVVLLGSILLNYLTALALTRTVGVMRPLLFLSALLFNAAALVYYKYTGFFWQFGNDISNGALSSHWPRPSVMLPIGISFFTFQAISYIIDVYTGHCKPARSLIDFGMYHSLFPQLIAGPIVRYVEIEPSIRERRVTLAMASEGMMRFIMGLSKKLIIADHTGLIADQIFKGTSKNRLFS